MSGLSRCRAPQQQNVALQKRSSRWESPLPALSVQSRRVARAHRIRVLRPAPPPRRTGHKSPRTVFSSQGNEKVIRREERQGRAKEVPSTEWEEEEGKRDGEAGTLLSIFADAARTSGPITASHRLSRPLHVLHAGRLAVTFKCHFQMPALAKWLQNAVFMLVGGE